METRVAVMAIIVEDTSAVEKLNAELHEYGKYIIGRMGLPYKAKKTQSSCFDSARRAAGRNIRACGQTRQRQRIKRQNGLFQRNGQ